MHYAIKSCGNENWYFHWGRVAVLVHTTSSLLEFIGCKYPSEPWVLADKGGHVISFAIELQYTAETLTHIKHSSFVYLSLSAYVWSHNTKTDYGSARLPDDRLVVRLVSLKINIIILQIPRWSWAFIFFAYRSLNCHKWNIPSVTPGFSLTKRYSLEQHLQY